MTSADFPTRLAELVLNDSSHNPSLYANLRSIRRSALSIPHRLHSILSDAHFAKEVSGHCGLPLVANERCGSWYIDPADKVGSAYFKSTDGHHSMWDFSLRRLNLQLFSILAKYGGAVIVDSTRRGKNLPDAFSKTVPIWVAVINRALYPEALSMHAVQVPPPPNELGESEVSQIDARLDKFTSAFCSLQLDLEKLRTELERPIQLNWAINGYFDVDSEDLLPSVGNHLLVLCSASRRVRGAEISEGGYIQGAGDDSEGWSHGLTAQIFWKHREKLMAAPEDDLPDLIQQLEEEEKPGTNVTGEGVKIPPTTNLHIGIGQLSQLGSFDLIINCSGNSGGDLPGIRNFQCRDHKLGSKDLRERLPALVDTTKNQLQKNRESQILVTCATGKDLSVGVAVALLCLFYDDEGQLKDDLGIGSTVEVNKQLVKQRLAWISSAKPDANPSRATLQAVNSFLMQRPDYIA
ncbi:initiator tRNA phosphoribosyl transferase [Exophiala viscosa]|uniref:Initiator tRNA phosphoribosyl transferase n=1 Tax=Exophiala viscosa TaxID=2486360 RepID=A0AAN6DWB3_9EURO|nr:initiator tRNA phosphoribosyl transferase [Exophiala viscosa]